MLRVEVGVDPPSRFGSPGKMSRLTAAVNMRCKLNCKRE